MEKVVIDKNTERFLLEYFCWWYTCPNCGVGVNTEFNFCPGCGSGIDWKIDRRNEYD